MTTHLIGTETQEIFDTIQNTSKTFPEALIPFEGSRFHQGKQETKVLFIITSEKATTKHYTQSGI